MKYADELALLAKEETVLRGVTVRLTEFGRCCGREMNVERKYSSENLKAAISNTDYDR